MIDRNMHHWVLYYINFGLCLEGHWTIWNEHGQPNYHRRTIQEIIALLPKENR